MYQEFSWASGDNRITFSGDIQQRILSFRQIKDSAPESGGLLLGRRIIDSQDCIVDEITSPMEGDHQKRYKFFRGKGHIVRQAQYWADTNSTGQLLGAWHTHPEADPSPSGTDLSDWRKVLKKCGGHNSPLFFVIIGQTKIRIWLGFKKSFGRPQILPCDFIGDDQ